MMPIGPSPAVMAVCWAGVKPSFIRGLPRQEHRAERCWAELADPDRGSAVSLPLKKVSMDLPDRPDFCLNVVGAVLGRRGVVATRQLLTCGAGSRLATRGRDHNSGRPRSNGDNGYFERTRRPLPVVARLELVQIGC